MKAQSAYMVNALDGQGVDRHLLGLRLLLDPTEPKPSIFTDPSFSLSSHWKLSTSQIPTECYDGWGFGEVVPDGLGVAYMLKNRSIHFNVTSLNEMPNEQFKQEVEKALLDLRRLFQATTPTPSVQTPTKVAAKL